MGIDYSNNDNGYYEEIEGVNGYKILKVTACAAIATYGLSLLIHYLQTIPKP